MIVVREVFQIEPSSMKQAKEAAAQMRALIKRSGYNMLRMLTDLTGKFYTLVFESEFKSLAEFEAVLGKGMADPEWGTLYPKFRSCMRGGRREIFTVVE